MKDKTSEGLFTLIDQFFRIINRFEKERTLFKTVIVSRINAEGCYYGNIDGQEYELPNDFFSGYPRHCMHTGRRL